MPTVNQVLADKVITPAYVSYNESMQGLALAVSGLCQAPGDESLAAAQEVYKASTDAWQRLQPIAFGPIEAKGLDARIHFWPDKHGTAGKQLSKLLAKPDPASLENGVAGKSAALAKPCRSWSVFCSIKPMRWSLKTVTSPVSLALAITDYQRDLADEVLDAWQGSHLALFSEV